MGGLEARLALSVLTLNGPRQRRAEPRSVAVREVQGSSVEASQDAPEDAAQQGRGALVGRVPGVARKECVENDTYQQTGQHTDDHTQNDGTESGPHALIVSSTLWPGE